MSRWWNHSASQKFKFLNRVINSAFLAAAILTLGWHTNSMASCSADNVTRVAANDECLVIETFGSTADRNQLIVFIHGDGTSGGPSDYLKSIAAMYGADGVISVMLIRPGYFDRNKNTSTGESYRLTGDVAFDEVARVASHITPVPGGVGPMTIALMLQNTLIAAG